MCQIFLGTNTTIKINLAIYLFRNVDDAIGYQDEVAPPISENNSVLPVENTIDLPVAVTTPTSVTTPTFQVDVASQQSTSYNTQVIHDDMLMKHLGSYPYEAPAGFHWVPNGWKLVPSNQSTPLNTRNKSFEEVFLDKVKGPVTKPKGKRMKLDLRGKIITQAGLLNKLKEKQQEKCDKETRKLEKQKNRNVSISNDESDEYAELTNDLDEEEEKEDSEEGTGESDEEEEDERMSMERCWECINPPIPESDIVGKWFACIYKSKKCANLFIGKATKRFLSDDINGYTCALEIDCLRQKFGVTDNIFQEYDVAGADVEIFPIQNIIYGPLKAKFLGARKWDFGQYHEIRKLFEKVKKMDRGAVHQMFICKTFSK